MTEAETFDVVIVGFGPTGAAAANLLGRDGVRTLVLERAPEIYTLPRAVHFDHEVMRIFQSMGLAESILPHTGPVAGYEFRNADGKLLMAFDLRDTITSQGWRSDYMFHQPSLERVLRDGAEKRDAVEVRLGRELVGLHEADEFVSVTVRNADSGDEETVRARYVIGCDGASSPTRGLAGIETEDLAFDEPWLVVDATVDRPPAELGFPEAPLQYCDPRRPVSVIPVVGPYIRWEFMLLPGEGSEMQAPDRVRGLVSDWVDPDRVNVIRSAVYRFHALIAQRWRAGRVLIAGDAAHQMPPFLGQGMCAGIRDVANLAWKLRLVLGGHAGEALLDSYGEERAPHVRSVIGTAIEMGKLICTQDAAVARARDASLLGGGLAPGGGAGGAPGSAPPLPGLTGGCLAEAQHPLVGELGLQARAAPHGGREALLDDLVEPGFTLLWHGTPPPLDDEAQRRIDRLGIQEVALGSREAVRAAVPLEDRTSAYASWFEGHDVCAALVRPDHAVFGAAQRAADVPGLLHALDAALR